MTKTKNFLRTWDENTGNHVLCKNIPYDIYYIWVLAQYILAAGILL